VDGKLIRICRVSFLITLFLSVVNHADCCSWRQILETALSCYKSRIQEMA